MSTNYKLGITKQERHNALKQIIEYYENNMSLQEIADIYGVSRQAISLKLTKNGYYPAKESKKIKRHIIDDNIQVNQLDEIKKLRLKIRALSAYNSNLRAEIKRLNGKVNEK